MTKVATKKSTTLADDAVEKYARKTRTQTKEKEVQETSIDEKFAKIEANPFHQIVVQSDASPTEKSKAVAQAMTYDETLTKEENEERVAAFEEFKEYLMAYRKEVSKEIIRLSDTEAFSELQAVFEEMNTALLDFENQINPLVEIIDAIHRLNVASDGAMYSVFKEIQEDREEEVRLKAERKKIEDQIDLFHLEIETLEQDIGALKGETRLFGMIGPSKKTLQDMERKKVAIGQKEKAITNARNKITGLASQRETEFAEFAEEKSKLRELLDITSEEHKERQEQLVQAALNFVNTTEHRTGSVLVHMQGVKDQIGEIRGVNGQIRNAFTIVTEGIKDAETENAKLTEKFNTAADNEGALEALEREQKAEAIHGHVDILTSSKVATLATLGDLQQENMNIKSMLDTNTAQINKTRHMHTSGTAGVASRLSTVLTAVSAAALNESSTAAKNTLESMNNVTNEIAQSEAISNATNMHVVNDDLAKLVKDLEEYKNISDKATDITRAALEDQKVLQAELEGSANELADSIKDARGLTAEVMQGGEEVIVVSDTATETGPRKSAIGQFKL